MGAPCSGHSPAHIRPRLPDSRHRLCRPPSLSPGPRATHPHRDPNGGDSDYGAQARLLPGVCPVLEGPAVVVGTVLGGTAAHTLGQPEGAG